MSHDALGALQRLSHDVRNALHGISVNLEVARSRTSRGVVDTSQIAPFLESAAQQLELATKLHKQFAALAMEHDDANAGPQSS